MRLYLVRHGVTAANKERRYCGRSETPLSPEGLRQAQLLAQRLAATGARRLYSSDLKRALLTAAALGRRLGLEPVACPALREADFGAWEGLTFAEAEAAYPEEMQSWLRDPFRFAPPGGETAQQVAERAWSFLEEHTSRREGPAIAVSHGGPLRLLLHRLLELPEERLWDIAVENSSVSLVYRSASGFRVAYYGCTRHLAGGASSSRD